MKIANILNLPMDPSSMHRVRFGDLDSVRESTNMHAMTFMS